MTVTNDDGTQHTWTADAAQTDSWDSGVLASGAAFTHRFSTVGTFSYHCTLHLFMTGTVVVG